MALVYTIAAIPTYYDGRLYRSRLEAKWAAFFDLCKWQFEYEPYDLGSWSPDFLIKGNDCPILVEIKPITEFDSDVAAKMTSAARETHFKGELLLLGASPFFHDGDYHSEWLGWLNDDWDPWRLREKGDPGSSDFFVSSFEPCWMVTDENGRVDFCHSTNGYGGRITGAWDGDHYCYGNMTALRHLWAQASNAVQWRK